jgi:hypothetical protein
MSLDNVEAAIEQGASIKLAQLEAAVRSIHKAAQKLPDECFVKQTAQWAMEIVEPQTKGFADVEIPKSSA